MTIQKKEEGNKVIVSLEGRLDTTTAPELEKALADVIDKTSELEFDFEKLEYVSSAGLRVLLNTHKQISKAGTMSICHVNEVIMEVFEVTGFIDILTIK